MCSDGNVKVSICTQTYNHEGFIRQCLDGFLMQKTKFAFEILINEDASSDQTADIIREYASRYPEIIKPIYQDQNLFSRGINALTERLFPRAKGDYIALCEGDDYWTDPLKLQKQIDVLENNSDIVACHHWQKCTMKDETGSYIVKEWPRNEDYGYWPQQISDVRSVLSFRMRPQTRTLVFRNVFLEHPIPRWFNKVLFGDVALSLILGQYGKFYFFDEDWAVYRMHDNGVSSLFSTKDGYIRGNTEWLRLYAYGLKHYRYRYSADVEEAMHIFFERIISKSRRSRREWGRLLIFVAWDLPVRLSFKMKLIKYLLHRSPYNVNV